MRLKSLFRTGIFNLIFQLLFITVMFFLGFEARIEMDSSFRFIILGTMVLISGFIWVWFFYLQDRREPEPIPYIITSFIAGMAIWALCAHPLLNIIFLINDWIHASTLLFILGSFLVKGVVFSLLMFGLLRYGFIPLKEFDEPVDGMVYGAVIGAGYAAVMVLYNLWQQPDYTLFIIVYTITTQVLAHSGIGSLIGYLIGQAKFHKKNLNSFSLQGVTVGIFLIGLYHLITEFLFVSGFTYAFWMSFVFTMIYALLILFFCMFKMRHLIQKKTPKPRRLGFRFKTVMIVYTLILLTAASVLSHYGQKGKYYENRDYGIGFTYPHSLSTYSFQGIAHEINISSNRVKMLFCRENTISPKFQFSLKVHKKTKELNEPEWLSYITHPKTESFLLNDIEVKGYRGKRISYSYLENPKTKQIKFPSLVKVIIDVIPQKKEIFIFTYSTSDNNFESGMIKYQKILSSVNWRK